MIIVSIVAAILVCLLSVSLTFKTICVKTISDNYMNISITNQIIDFVIDHYTDITNQQLKSLQNDLVDSHELYRFNEQAFDQAVYNIEKQDTFYIDDETVENFTITCIELIEKNLNRTLSSSEQQEIADLLENDSLWSRFFQNLNEKISSKSFFIKIYIFSNTYLFKIILMIFILGLIVLIMKEERELMMVYFFVIAMLSSLLNYLLLGVVYLLTPLFASLLNIESLVIPTDPILYIAMSLLILSLVLFGMIRKSYS